MTTASRGDAASLFAIPKTVAEHRADGSIVLRSSEPLRDCARCIGDWLEHFARQTPDTVFLAERDSADTPWATVTYAGALRRVRAAASWILAQGLSAERPVVILSEAERHLETKEERATRVFLEDPERALKIFFTSYFIDKGLMWWVALFPALTTR